jgi:hypothetical protein
MEGFSFSKTHARITRMMEYMTSALIKDLGVEIIPGDVWSTDPYSDPPKLTYRVADVPVIGEKVLHLIAHDIATLKYTTRWRFRWGKKKPSDMLEQAAVHLFHVIEGARVDRTFSESYGGAASLFEEMHGEGDRGMWNEKVMSGFSDLPARWKFVLNADRMMWGLPALGKMKDVERADGAYDDLLKAVFAENSQGCATGLMPVIRGFLADAVCEDEEMEERIRKILEQKNKPKNQEPEETEEKETESTENSHDPAEEDDGQEGGSDGTPGKRKKAHGGEDSDAGGAPDEGEDAGEEQGEDEGSGTDAGGTDEDEDDETDGVADGGDGDEEEDVEAGEEEDGDDEDDESQVRPANIVEEMLEENKYSSNQTIKELADSRSEMSDEADRIEDQINQESTGLANLASRVYGDAAPSAIVTRMEENAILYRLDREPLQRLIAQLRGHAQNVLFENALQRWRGNYSSGRKIIARRLASIPTGETDVFARRRDQGGRSYAIELVIDQSVSMVWSSDKGYRHPGEYCGPDLRVPQRLAYEASIIFCEALWDLAEIGVVGFTEFSAVLNDSEYKMETLRGRNGRPLRKTAQRMSQNARLRSRVDSRGVELPHAARHYLRHGDSKMLLPGLLPEISRAYRGTPTQEGIRNASAELRNSNAEVKAIVMVTDGAPNSVDKAIAAANEARRQGIQVLGLMVKESLIEMTKRRPGDVGRMMPGGRFYGKTDMEVIDIISNEMFDRHTDVTSASDIVPAVIRLLRGLIRRSAA